MTTLTLFDAADLTGLCDHCGRAPATTRITWAPNLLVHAYATPDANARYARANGVRYRLAPRHKAACDWCAWILGCAYWDATYACPTGRCALWAHTWEQPGYACARHHHEDTVVWREALNTPAGVTA